jgi:hypothetical protein
MMEWRSSFDSAPQPHRTERSRCVEVDIPTDARGGAVVGDDFDDHAHGVAVLEQRCSGRIGESASKHEYPGDGRPPRPSGASLRRVPPLHQGRSGGRVARGAERTGGRILTAWHLAGAWILLCPTAHLFDHARASWKQESHHGFRLCSPGPICQKSRVAANAFDHGALLALPKTSIHDQPARSRAPARAGMLFAIVGAVAEAADERAEPADELIVAAVGVRIRAGIR